MYILLDYSGTVVGLWWCFRGEGMVVAAALLIAAVQNTGDARCSRVGLGVFFLFAPHLVDQPPSDWTGICRVDGLTAVCLAVWTYLVVILFLVTLCLVCAALYPSTSSTAVTVLTFLFSERYDDTAEISLVQRSAVRRVDNVVACHPTYWTWRAQHKRQQPIIGMRDQQ